MKVPDLPWLGVAPSSGGGGAVSVVRDWRIGRRQTSRSRPGEEDGASSRPGPEDGAPSSRRGGAGAVGRDQRSCCHRLGEESVPPNIGGGGGRAVD
ncbi:hypothetical protein PR202_gb28468 [Eleusine coracana subsp. coracana]|uniref:Uncharacterized protein n=1 Tax=Eleusine coracana subsp. coracana TaxID=191504 RepID=A0AAV5FWG7_ELECO|nr:hypothetical protein PR202_gb28468 [Eleusine coracana subsp. coracana]